MKKVIVDIDRYRKISKTLLLILIIITALPYTPITLILEEQILRTYWIPLLWWILCCVVLFRLPRIHPVGKHKYRDGLFFDALICATLLIGTRLLAAFFVDKFGLSPYDLSLLGIVANLYRIVPSLLARELIRSYYLGTYCRHKNNLGIILISLLLAFSNISFDALIQIKGLEKFVTYFAETLGPEISINILLSYFALYGGAGVSFLYIGIIEGFSKFSPILPDLQWFTQGVVNIAVPMTEIVYITGKYEQSHFVKMGNKETIINVAQWTITCGISIALIWFSVGVFPIYPHVIATGSMRPMIYEGDVILIQRITKEEEIDRLNAGDIIQFTRDDILITHRIIEVVKDNKNNIRFRTKGDNNSVSDVRLVLPEEVKGTLKKVIPKLGIPTLWIKTHNSDQPTGVTN